MPQTKWPLSVGQSEIHKQKKQFPQLSALPRTNQLDSLTADNKQNDEVTHASDSNEFRLQRMPLNYTIYIVPAKARK